MQELGWILLKEHLCNPWAIAEVTKVLHDLKFQITDEIVQRLLKICTTEGSWYH